jgi:hypothetical protein
MEDEHMVVGRNYVNIEFCSRSTCMKIIEALVELLDAIFVVVVNN